MVCRVANKDNKIKITVDDKTEKTLTMTELTLNQKLMPSSLEMNSMTVAQIKKELDKTGVNYNKKATKADLLKLLQGEN